MLEVFALPYLAVTGGITWAIFEPFFRINDADSPSRAHVTISDLLAAPLPVSFVFLGAGWIMPAGSLAFSVQVIVLVSALALAATSLVVGLFLVPRTFQVTFLKRMAIVGVIAPFGTLLTIGWIGIAGWACFYSIAYLAPAMVGIALATFGLRVLSLWVCQIADAKGVIRRGESKTRRIEETDGISDE